MPCTARGFGDPQTSDLQPATPEEAEHPAQHVAAPAAQDEVDRAVVGQTGGGDIVHVEAVHNELPRRLADERLELDPHRLHRTVPALQVASIASLIARNRRHGRSTMIKTM